MRMSKIYLLATLIILSLLVMGGTAGEARQAAPPLLEAYQQVTPEEIFVSGSGLQPSVASVTLTLVNPAPVTPLDVMLVLDASDSAELDAVQAMAQGVIAQLGEFDRVGVLVYAGRVRTLVALTNDFQSASETVADILPSNGSDLIGALHLANYELLRHGRADAARVIVFASTGLSCSWDATLAQAEQAAELGIRIFGFGASEASNYYLLSRLANRTGGTFYSHYSTNGLAALFAELPRQSIPPSDIVVTEVLPPYVDYVGAEINPPTRIERLTPLSPTLLTWVIPMLPEANRWKTTFNVSVSQPGRLSIFSDLPLIRYLSYEGAFMQMRQIILPTERLTVRSAPMLDFEFGPINPAVGQTTVFIGEASQDSSIVKWEWDFGDQTTGSGPVVLHRYKAPGSYKVRLTITDRHGVTATLEKTLTVSAPAQ
jgi:hypothetical protein